MIVRTTFPSLCCFLTHFSSLVCLPLNRKTSLWSVQREASFHPQCCHCLSLSSHPHLISAQWKKCVCVFVYSCCSATSSAFLSLSLSFYFCSFLELLFFPQISATSCSSPSTLPRSLFLSLSTSPQKPILLVAMGSGCHAAQRFSHGSRMYACLL